MKLSSAHKTIIRHLAEILVQKYMQENKNAKEECGPKQEPNLHAAPPVITTSM